MNTFPAARPRQDAGFALIDLLFVVAIIDPVYNRFFATNASGAIYEANVSLFAAMPEAAAPPFGTPIQ